MKLKNVLKPQVIDGQILESISAELEDGESLENVDILKYLDSLASDDTMDQDLSTYKVVLTNVETRLVSLYLKIFTKYRYKIGHIFKKFRTDRQYFLTFENKFLYHFSVKSTLG